MTTYLGLVSKFDDKGLKQAQKAFGGLQSSFRGIAAGIATAFSVAAITNFASEAIKAAEAAKVADARLDQIAKSMDIFGSSTSTVTARLKNYAEQNMLVVGADDEVIKSTQAKLLTFKNLAMTADEAGGSFDRATQAAFDLAAAGFGSAETNAVQLGKALQDPIKGLTALSRSGVTFTATEKERIKTLVESNQVGEAQRLILEAIEKQVGGTAAATVTASTKMSLLFGELQEDIGQALLPAFEEIASVIQTEVIPIIGPQLEAAVKKVNWKQVGKDIGDFLINISQNINNIINFGKQIAVAAGVFFTLRTAIQVATVAQQAFNLVAKANPYILVATILAASIPLVLEYGKAVQASMTEEQRASEAKRSMVGRQKAIAEGFQKGKPAVKAYKAEIAGLTGEMKRYLDLKAEVQLAKANDAWARSWQLRGAKALEAKETQEQILSGGSSLKSAKDQVREYVKASQTAILDAQKAYTNAEKAARKANTEALVQLEKDYGARLADIVQQSKDRLRSAYASAASFDLNTLFGEDAERSVTTLINNLRAKLTSSKALIESAGKLASAGFKQTFIEQIVSTGTAAGNEIATAILSSSPEAQAELRQLFSDLEDTGNTGMDSLADELFNKQKLATTALTDLYKKTQEDYLQAVKDENQALSDAITEANNVLGESLKKIKKDFEDNIASMDGALGGLNKTIDALIAKLDGLIKKTQKAGGAQPTSLADVTAAGSAQANAVKQVAGIVIDSAEDIAGVYNYLGERAQAAQKYLASTSLTAAQRASATATLQAIQSQQTGIYEGLKAGGTEAVVGTVININVKTDTTQSAAMVGRTIGKTVSKYTAGGGQILISPEG